MTADGLQGARLDQLLGSSLRFEPLCGDVTHIRRPHTTGWRTLPGLVCAQLQRGRSVVSLDGATLPVRTGEMIVLPAGVHHRVDLVAPTAVSRWVHAKYSVMHSLDLFSLLSVPPVVPRKLGARVGDEIEAWVATEAAGGDPLLRHARRNAFGYRLLALLRPEAERSLDGIAAVQAVIEHMDRNLGRPISRDALAEVAGLSRAQFHRVFTQAMGCSPVRFLRNIRLRLAQQLLISTAEPVKVIAGRCGYEDVFVFSKAFKRDCGLSPRLYRQRTGELRTGGVAPG